MRGELSAAARDLRALGRGAAAALVGLKLSDNRVALSAAHAREAQPVAAKHDVAIGAKRADHLQLDKVAHGREARDQRGGGLVVEVREEGSGGGGGGRVGHEKSYRGGPTQKQEAKCRKMKKPSSYQNSGS